MHACYNLHQFYGATHQQNTNINGDCKSPLYHTDSEETIVSSNINCTFLAPGGIMRTLLNLWRQILLVDKDICSKIYI